MHPAVFSLILIALHVSVPVECRRRLQHPQQQQHQQQHQPGRANTGTDSGLHGSVRQGVHTGFLVILPVRTASSNFVSIFDLRRKRFLCMGTEGGLYTSRQKDKEDCLFQRIWLDMTKHHDVFYSSSGNRLLNLRRAELHRAQREPPEPSSVLLERILNPLVKRRRRSEEVNPSDPLRSESHPSRSSKDLKDGKPEQDQTGAVSKETITSCDDPLRVLQPNRPISPLKTNIADQAQHQ